MKKIGFIGAYDKIDLIVYVAKILTTLDKKVLVVDTTVNQKAKYILPTIDPTKTYVTEFEGIDIAIGFNNVEEIQQYSSVSKEEDLEYDIMLVDTDSIEGFNKFELQNADKNYFVTCFDVYSLKKGLEVLKNLEKPLALTKIMFSKEMLKEEEEYLDYLSENYKVIWKENKIYFPIENGDLSVIYENQRVEKIKFRKLSVQYKDGMEFIAEEILENVKEAVIRRAIRTIEKGE